MTRPGLRRLAGLVADRADLDAAGALPASPSQHTALRILARMNARVRRESGDLPPERSVWVDVIGALMGILASTQCVLALLTVAIDGLAISSTRVPRGYQLTTMIVSATAAAVLATIARRDPAARALALLYIGIAAAFSTAVASAEPTFLPAALRPLWSGVLRLPGDLALLVGAWSFVRHFPRAEAGTAVQRIVAVMARVAAIAAAVLLLLNGWLLLARPGATDFVTRTARIVDRHGADTSYWAVVFPLLALATPFAIRKLQIGYVTSPRQVRRFLLGLALGLGPLAVLSIAGSSSAAAAAWLRREDVFPVATVLVFAGLWTLPLTTAFAVLDRQVLPLHFVVRRSLQYTLTRRALTAAMVLPVAGAALQLAANPGQTIGAFMASGGAAWLLAAGLAIVAALARRPLLAGLDRLFLRTAADPRLLIADLGLASRRRLSARDAADALVHATREAFRPRTTALLVTTEGPELVALVGASRSLARESALARVLEASPTSLLLGEDADRVARLLPTADLAWAASHDWRVMTPLHGEGEQLIGVLCMGARVNADTYTSDDLATLEALCSSIAPLVATRLAGSAPHDAAPQQFGTECERCGSLFDDRTRSCPCGGAIVGSSLPLRVAGRFTLERRLGRGGMGVVYLAKDDALERDVALKTLPEVGPEESLQLRTEARTMAGLQHPGLAFVLGLETVGPLPVLVVEYLAGGTLAERLRRERLAAPDVVDLGIALSDALEYLHDTEVLHRDLKPSNVGFTASGRPKLLDFGVAVSASAVSGAAGTLLYMPPEAFRGQPPTPLFDLWGLGVLLCEAWLAKHPLSGMSPDKQMRSLEAGALWAGVAAELEAAHPALAAVLARCLSPSANDRFPTARSIHVALNSLR